jgi:hypothetical protein
MMRRSPDGKRDVYVAGTPLQGKKSRIVLISGLGLPTKIGIGATDLPDETWLEIHNRDVGGSGLRYDTIEDIHGGMVRLHARAHQGRDQTFSPRAEATFGHGTLSQPKDEEGEIMEMAEGDTVYPLGVTAWLITDGRGKAVLVAPYQTNSDEIADIVKDHIHGEFTVENVFSGTMTAADELTAHGWPLAKSAYAPAPGVTFN